MGSPSGSSVVDGNTLCGRMPLTTYNNVPVPSFMYGTAWKKEATTQLVQLAVAAGFTAIDTANQLIHYQEASGRGSPARPLRSKASREIASFFKPSLPRRMARTIAPPTMPPPISPRK